jgi:hypothetical protein
VTTLLLDGNYQSSDFAVGLNGLSHEVLTTTAAPCFVTGTRLLTERGEVAVEALLVGDRLPTCLGRRLARVVWIGHRAVDCRRRADPAAVMPVRVAAGAFGGGLPVRDLWLSPDHAVYVDGALVPVRHLVNGDSIARMEVAGVTYWHVELAAHDIVLAGGLPVETYLDTGNRGAFANGGGVTMASPAFARAAWDDGGCAPLLEGGKVVAALRARLAAVPAARLSA